MRQLYNARVEAMRPVSDVQVMESLDTGTFETWEGGRCGWTVDEPCDTNHYRPMMRQ